MLTYSVWSTYAYRDERDPTINEPTLVPYLIDDIYGGSIPVTWLNTVTMVSWELVSFTNNDPEIALLTWWDKLTNTYIRPTEEQILAQKKTVPLDG